MSRCREADRLRMNWYQMRDELSRLLYEEHRRNCPVCREIMIDLTAQARQAEMPELEEDK